MLKSILRNIELIKDNPFYGNPINKKLIPKEYLKKYKAQNLYRLELPYFYRMLYTLKDGEVEIVALILDILDHKQYNKKFKYK
jgi:hypothetical protein